MLVQPRYVKLVTVPSICSPTDIIGYCVPPNDIISVFVRLFLVLNHYKHERMGQVGIAENSRCVTKAQQRQQRVVQKLSTYVT